MRVSTPSGFWALPPLRALWVPSGVPHEVEMVGAVSMRSLYIRADAASAYWPECQVIEVGGLLRELILALTAEPIDYPEDGRAGQIAALVQSELAAARGALPDPLAARPPAAGHLRRHPGPAGPVAQHRGLGRRGRRQRAHADPPVPVRAGPELPPVGAAAAAGRRGLPAGAGRAGRARRGQPGLPSASAFSAMPAARSAPRRSAICRRSPHEATRVRHAADFSAA